jgi:hypothetical protein
MSCEQIRDVRGVGLECRSAHLAQSIHVDNGKYPILIQYYTDP